MFPIFIKVDGDGWPGLSINVALIVSYWESAGKDVGHARVELCGGEVFWVTQSREQIGALIDAERVRVAELVRRPATAPQYPLLLGSKWRRIGSPEEFLLVAYQAGPEGFALLVASDDPAGERLPVPVHVLRSHWEVVPK